MYDIERKFEELPLLIGAGFAALLNGQAVINVHGKGSWDYEEITLASPIADKPDVVLGRGELFDAVCASIDKIYGDEIYTETLEIMRGDPDREHDALSA